MPPVARVAKRILCCLKLASNAKEAERVGHAIFRYAPLRAISTPLHVTDPIGRMCIGIDNGHGLPPATVMHSPNARSKAAFSMALRRRISPARMISGNGTSPAECAGLVREFRWRSALLLSGLATLAAGLLAGLLVPLTLLPLPLLSGLLSLALAALALLTLLTLLTLLLTFLTLIHIVTHQCFLRWLRPAIQNCAGHAFVHGIRQLGKIKPGVQGRGTARRATNLRKIQWLIR